MTRTLKLRSRVVSIGDAVEEFRSAGVLVFFQEGAPDELAEFSVLHAATINLATVAPGDSLRLGAETFDVLGVGDVANENLANLGHLVVKANNRTEPEMLGDVCVDAKPLPHLNVGDEIEILGPEQKAK
ncbi:MAG TPA: PTS glucitol/sorbitol transporter subunit IIA [Candidatus Saccharimonadales bacterium]|nr:PTS glucitol/sorbitol transporter subunit IIA [Candidatus Saccharimonadales bacterium]